MKYNYYFFLFCLSTCLILPAAERTGGEIMSHGASTLYFYAENNRWDDFEVYLQEVRLQNIFLPKAKSGDDYADENGLTLLHLAVKANQKKSVELLLQMGATVKTDKFFEKDGKLIEVPRPLEDATRLGYLSIVEILKVAKIAQKSKSTHLK